MGGVSVGGGLESPGEEGCVEGFGCGVQKGRWLGTGGLRVERRETKGGKGKDGDKWEGKERDVPLSTSRAGMSSQTGEPGGGGVRD